MILLGLPVSTSQAAVGAILGIGFLNKQLNVAGLGKVIACWFGTPIGGLLMALRTRGETVDEYAAAAAVMRAKCRKVRAPDGAIDIVGTGGDGAPGRTGR